MLAHARASRDLVAADGHSTIAAIVQVGARRGGAVRVSAVKGRARAASESCIASGAGAVATVDDVARNSCCPSLAVAD